MVKTECIPYYETSMSEHSIQSVRRALRILKTFSYDSPRLELKEIARANDLPKSTTHRILSTLELEGFIRQSSLTGTYQLGMVMFELGNLALSSTNIRTAAVPRMERLSAESGEATHLGILSNGEVVSFEVTPAQRGLTVGIRIGDRAPLHCTGVGKATLAFQPEEEIQRVLTHPLQRFTARTIVESTRLDRELQSVREKGYAVDDSEHEEGIRCVAAPVWNRTGKVIGSLSISGPSMRIDKRKIPALAEMVKAVAAEISRELGYSPWSSPT